MKIGQFNYLGCSTVKLPFFEKTYGDIFFCLWALALDQGVLMYRYYISFQLLICQIPPIHCTPKIKKYLGVFYQLICIIPILSDLQYESRELKLFSLSTRYSLGSSHSAVVSYFVTFLLTCFAALSFRRPRVGFLIIYYSLFRIDR